VARTFWSVVSKGRSRLPGQAVKVGRRGFGWGVLNQVERARHDEIYAGARYDSGQVYADLMEPPPVEEGRIRVPTLTVGAGRDRATVVASVRKVARKYAAAPVRGDGLEYPVHGHWIVDEPGTDLVTADIVTWLARKVPEPVRRAG
ncbi:MAG: alpha/beta hydrolase, partial [Pseudomonadota bacterium]